MRPNLSQLAKKFGVCHGSIWYWWDKLNKSTGKDGGSRIQRIGVRRMRKFRENNSSKNDNTLYHVDQKGSCDQDILTSDTIETVRPQDTSIDLQSTLTGCPRFVKLSDDVPASGQFAVPKLVNYRKAAHKFYKLRPVGRVEMRLRRKLTFDVNRK